MYWYARCVQRAPVALLGPRHNHLRLSTAVLEAIDSTWTELGFTSRSEFLRYAARDAVNHPAFSGEGWKQIVASEHELRSCDAELGSREAVVELMERDGDGE